MNRRCSTPNMYEKIRLAANFLWNDFNSARPFFYSGIYLESIFYTVAPWPKIWFLSYIMTLFAWYNFCFWTLLLPIFSHLDFNMTKKLLLNLSSTQVSMLHFLMNSKSWFSKKLNRLLSNHKSSKTLFMGLQFYCSLLLIT